MTNEIIVTDLAQHIENVANAVDARYDAAKSKARIKPRFGVVIDPELAALKAIAATVELAKEEGYAPMIAEGLIGRGEFRAAERKAIIYGATATDTPTLPEGKSRAGCGTVNNAARNGSIRHIRGRESDIKTWDNTPGTQKLDSADTGEWFAVAE